MMLLQAPDSPIRTRPIVVDERTTPARLTARVITGARRYTLPAALLSVTHQLGEALVPVIMGFAIERAVSTGDVLAVVPWLAALAADFALLSFSWRFGSRIGELGMLAVQHRLRALVTEHLLRSDAARAPGVALSLATSDVNRLSYAVEIGVHPIGQLAAVVFGGAVLLSISWPLGLVVLLGAPLLLWLTERAGGSLRRRSEEEQELAAEAAGRAADLMAGYRVIRGIGAEAEAVRRYRSVSRAALGGTLRARGAEGRFIGGMDAVTGLFLTAVSVAAALFAVGGALSVGELITVVGLTQFLIAPLQSAATDTGTLWASGIASAARLLTLLRGAESPAEPDAAAERLVDSVGPGEIVTVVAGGATAADLVRRIAVARPEALVAPHASHLFGGSVRENVALDGVTASRALDALLAAGCEDFADGLPHGYDTAVGENGGALSGGQRQRVALARALAQDASVLVLHEPTTAVDAVTEAAIAERLRPFRGAGRTLVISGSSALAAAADRVVTL